MDNQPDRKALPEPLRLDNINEQRGQEAHTQNVEDNTEGFDQLQGVEEAQFDQVGQPKENRGDNQDPARKKRRIIIASALVVLVIILVIVMMSGGSETKTAPVATTTQSVASGKDSLNKTTPNDGAPKTSSNKAFDKAAAKAKKAAASRNNALSALPTEKERAAGEALLSRVEKFIKKSDHPADGIAGVLVNNPSKMAKVISRETGVKTVAGNSDDIGVVGLTIERKVGLCILTTRVGKSRMTLVRNVKIINIGLLIN